MTSLGLELDVKIEMSYARNLCKESDILTEILRVYEILHVYSVFSCTLPAKAKCIMETQIRDCKEKN
jgi:hypothetical protein